MSKSFDKKKKKMLEKLQEFKEVYDEFTKDVSPRDWRVTGTHFADLNKMERAIYSFREMTEEERLSVEIDGVFDKN